MAEIQSAGAALADAKTMEDVLAAVDAIQREHEAARPGEATPNPLKYNRDCANRRMIFTDAEEARQSRINLQCRELPRSDLGNSQRFALRYGRDIQYCHPFKSWYIFDGQRWARDDRCGAQEYGKDCILRLGDEAPDLDFSSDSAAMFKWAATSQAHARINGMLDLAKSALALSPDKMDSNPALLNFPNGTLDLKTLIFRQHDRFDLISKVTRYNYDPDAVCPTWEKFLQTIMNDNENLIRFLQRSAGYTLTGNTGERAFFLCHGQGANGKSTFLNTLQNIIGDYGISVESSTFCVSRGESVRNDLAALKGARLVTATEAGKGKRLDEEIIKKLTGGGDTIRARFLFQEFFEYKPECKIWWSFNTTPRITDSTDSIWARVKMIPFSVVIPAAERDIHLSERLLKEASGIMNWMLDGLREYQRIGLAEPDEVRAATADYRENEDTLSDFFKDRCLLEPTVTCEATELYQDYVKWMNMEAPEEKLKSQRSFGFDMGDRGFKKDRDGATKRKIYHGIRLKKGGF